MDIFDFLKHFSIIITKESPSDSFSLSPYLSPALVIVTFTLTALLASFTRRNEAERSWYLKSYFDPQIKMINDFFENIPNDVLKTKRESQTNMLFHGDFKIEYIGNARSKLSDEIRLFKVKSFGVLREIYPDVHERVQNDLMEFEDAVSSFLETEDGIDEIAFWENVQQVRSHIIIHLSRPALTFTLNRIIRQIQTSWRNSR